MSTGPGASFGRAPRDHVYIRPRGRRLSEYEAVTCYTQPGPDAFDLHEESGVINEVSRFDLTLMNVLGWNLVPAVRPNQAPPAATTADMILRHGADGFYEIYDIGNNAILAGYSLGQIGTDWQFVGLGPFFGTDTTDMLLRSASTGGFEVYDISNNNITNAAFLGTVGMDWQVMGFGNFSSRGETDMILRNVNSGGVEVYDINNNQITGSAFMGTVGLNWQFSGVGNFRGAGESDVLLRDANTGGLEIYDIASNAVTNAAFIGAVGTAAASGPPRRCSIRSPRRRGRAQLPVYRGQALEQS